MKELKWLNICHEGITILGQINYVLKSYKYLVPLSIMQNASLELQRKYDAKFITEQLLLYFLSGDFAALFI